MFLGYYVVVLSCYCNVMLLGYYVAMLLCYCNVMLLGHHVVVLLCYQGITLLQYHNRAYFTYTLIINTLQFSLSGAYNFTINNLNCRLSIDEVKELICNKATKNANYLEQLEIEAEKKKHIDPSDFVCSVCNSSICIAENGNVYPCAGWQDYIVGNIKNTPLNNIWNNSEKIQYLRDLRRRDFPKCIHCADKEYCTMCMVRNANESPLGNPLAVNEYFCNIAKINKELAIEWKNRI